MDSLKLYVYYRCGRCHGCGCGRCVCCCACWSLLVVVGCCWLLLVVAGWCWLLLVVVACCWLLLVVMVVIVVVVCRLSFCRLWLVVGWLLFVVGRWLLLLLLLLLVGVFSLKRTQVAFRWPARELCGWTRYFSFSMCHLQGEPSLCQCHC